MSTDMIPADLINAVAKRIPAKPWTVHPKPDWIEDPNYHRGGGQRYARIVEGDSAVVLVVDDEDDPECPRNVGLISQAPTVLRLFVEALRLHRAGDLDAVRTLLQGEKAETCIKAVLDSLEGTTPVNPRIDWTAGETIWMEDPTYHTYGGQRYTHISEGMSQVAHVLDDEDDPECARNIFLVTFAPVLFGMFLAANAQGYLLHWGVLRMVFDRIASVDLD